MKKILEDQSNCVNTIKKFFNEDEEKVKNFLKKFQNPEEDTEFVESLNSDQFQSITEIIGKSPYLNYTMKFNCEKCGHSHKRELNGLADFFQ